MRCLFCLLLVACAAPSPRWRASVPPALPAGRSPGDPARIALSYALFPWHALTQGSAIPLFVAHPGGNPYLGEVRALGPVRSADEPLPRDTTATLSLAWGPRMLDSPGFETPESRSAIRGALEALRMEAADAGADAVREVRCFAREADGHAVVWCEGQAVVCRAPPPVDREDEVRFENRRQAGPSSWLIGGSFNAGLLGDSAVDGQTIFMDLGGGRHVLDLGINVSASVDREAVELGLEVGYRRRWGRNELGLGVTGVLFTDLTDDEEAKGPLRAGAGPTLTLLHRMKPLFFGGYGRPYVSLRASWTVAPPAADMAAHDLAGPGLQLTLGMATP